MAVSGGFDPPHKGHYSMFKNAYEYSEKTFDHEKNIFIHRPTKVVAILNSDDWLKRKKGYSFMSFDERKFILESCKYIDYVIGVDDTDGTVCSALLDIQPDIFANGGDRKEGNTPEVDICSQLNIKVIWGIGGDKIQSSSDLVSNVKK
jgi:D-beta-D-heptose 7-phosphate kinase/D-beta-D-heptose 1-phosphate adenosyltransferase